MYFFIWTSLPPSLNSEAIIEYSYFSQQYNYLQMFKKNLSSFTGPELEKLMMRSSPYLECHIWERGPFNQI